MAPEGEVSSPHSPLALPSSPCLGGSSSPCLCSWLLKDPIAELKRRVENYERHGFTLVAHIDSWPSCR